MAPTDDSHGDMEQQLREAILTGQLVDQREGNTSVDAAAHGSQWGARRTVPAALLADLLTRGDGPAQPRALRLAGARITGRLDLEAAHLACPVLLWGCWFEEPVALTEATVPALRLPGCHLPALDAEQLTTRGNVELRHGFHARGEVNLGGAHIGGSLILDGATLNNPDGRALYADRLTVDQAMLCQEGFSVHGAVHLEGAHIGGSLRLKGATLSNPGGYALFARRLTVDQNMACQGFSVHGEADLDGARIGGGLLFEQATFTNPGGAALILAELRAEALLLRELAQPPDKVVLVGTQVAALVDDPSGWPRTTCQRSPMTACSSAPRSAPASGWTGLVAIPAATARNPTSSWPASTAAPAATRTPARSRSPSNAPAAAPSPSPSGYGVCSWMA